MKFLSEYVEAAQTALFDSTGAFFAFSTDQYNESRVEGVKYVSVGAGLICPKGKVKALTDGLDGIQERGIASDMKENGAKAIIHRELANHECQIVHHPGDAIEKLEGYPITEAEILAEWPSYMAHCIENDLF